MKIVFEMAGENEIWTNLLVASFMMFMIILPNFMFQVPKVKSPVKAKKQA
jgi:hypothetical protein